MDHYVKMALEEAKHLNEIEQPKTDPLLETLRFLQHRRERYFRRISAELAGFHKLPLRTGGVLLVEKESILSSTPCMRFMEELAFAGGRLADIIEKRALVEIFVEITDDNDHSFVQCRAECLWEAPSIKIISCDPDNFMTLLVKQLAHLLKV